MNILFSYLPNMYKQKFLQQHNKCNNAFPSYLIISQLRVSSVMSNSPYILVLDCDMFCNDPTSARYAMCFHLDPKISSSLAFVQFPQKFHNISKNDIYDSQLRSIFTVRTSKHAFRIFSCPPLYKMLQCFLWYN